MRDATDPLTSTRDATVVSDGELVRLRVARQIELWRAEPWKLDFFAALRRLEALAVPAPRWGFALRPNAEALRVGQDPSLSFAPAGVSGFELAGRGAEVPRLRQYFFGYLGPNGPLPVHLNDVIRERAHNQGDGTWLAFLDGFAHRFALHFYRAWTQPRAAVALDRPEDDAWRRWVGALVGIGTAPRQQRDAIPDDARLHFSGWLSRQVHSAEGVRQVIAGFFDVPTGIDPWVGHWLPIAQRERTYLGGRTGGSAAACRLGGGAVLGRQVWDRQHRVRLRLGPLDFARYRQFLPNGTAQPALRCWMRQLLGDELQWDAELILRKDEVPSTRLGQGRGNSPRLGWVSWLGERPRSRDAADVRLPADTPVRMHRSCESAGFNRLQPEPGNSVHE